jgi:hypothetical protein
MPSGEATSFSEKSAEADIPFWVWLKGYRTHLRARTLALGVAFMISGSLVVGETAGSVKSDQAAAACSKPAQASTPACEPGHQEQSSDSKAVVALIVGSCLMGAGVLCSVTAGSPEGNMPSSEVPAPSVNQEA